ncbi:WD repeat-containing protein 74 [Oncorhynchus kisutch]|uniref:WD repeat-containing protein 74 n=1 Tax=Oncorhynchus kisutch TaxID=8019 RepID=UPI0009A07A1E|nr:WD repeat-containing protein 74 [Oncorhynchus kisutch]
MCVMTGWTCGCQSGLETWPSSQTQTRWTPAQLNTRPRVCGCFKGAGRRGVGASVPPFSLVASCGLDRFLRVHSLEDRSLRNKVYLKSRLNCVLLSSGDLELGSTGVNRDVEEVKEDRGELDKVWNTVGMIKEKAKKRETDEAVVEEAEKMKLLLKRQRR